MNYFFDSPNYLIQNTEIVIIYSTRYLDQVHNTVYIVLDKLYKLKKSLTIVRRLYILYIVFKRLMTDIDEYVKRRNEILTQLSTIEQNNFMSKKEFIIKLKEVERPLLKSGHYPDRQLSDLCSLIGETLEKYNVSYPRTKLPELFDDDEKRTYNKPTTNVTKSDNSNSPPLKPEQDQGVLGQIDFMEKAIGKSWDEMVDYDPADKLLAFEKIATKSVNHIKTFTKKLFTAQYFVGHFESNFGTVEKAEALLKSLPKKERERLQSLITIYHSNVLLISDMEESLADITENQIKEIQATQAVTSKQLDERNKLTNWEKLSIILAMKCAGIAKNQCAKINGIDKKHITNNILPRTSPTESQHTNKHHDYISWFKNITISLGGKQYTFDISQWFDGQIERKKLQLPFEPLVLVDSVVE